MQAPNEPVGRARQAGELRAQPGPAPETPGAADPDKEKLLHRLVEQQSELARLRKEVERLARGIAEREGQISALERHARDLESLAVSTSSKLAHPVRLVLHRLIHRLPSPRVLARKVAKVVWWTVTFQLFERLSARQRYRASLKSGDQR